MWNKFKLIIEEYIEVIFQVLSPKQKQEWLPVVVRDTDFKNFSDYREEL